MGKIGKRPVRPVEEGSLLKVPQFLAVWAFRGTGNSGVSDWKFQLQTNKPKL
jgi:hypothetical protein